jgi:uncharacterized membrane protein
MSSVVSTPAPHVISPLGATSGGDRLEQVDFLRGLVMMLMALDHTRDYFHYGAVHGLDPLDLNATTVPIFLTRWVTHYCAPVFMFLAGTGAFLSTTRGRSKRELSWFLVTRGLWLVALDLTLVQWAGWSFQFTPEFLLGAVLWALGWSMVTLAALIHLPMRAIVTIAAIMILGHNALDGIKPEAFGSFAWLWKILHAGGPVELWKGTVLWAGYPLIPWIGVMAAGYGLGSVLVREREERRRIVLRIGLAATAAFIVLRFTNLYGDAREWAPHARPGFGLLSFLHCTKYPPSLCYLLMTLGPALVLLSWLDRKLPRAAGIVSVFGRVPMFYYLLHIPLIHALAIAVERTRFDATPWLFGLPFGPHDTPVPANAGFGLFWVYVATAVVLALLYPLCRWFAGVKRRRRDWWVSYF